MFLLCSIHYFSYHLANNQLKGMGTILYGLKSTLALKFLFYEDGYKIDLLPLNQIRDYKL